ncbi:hypothetical protein [Ectobacillus ponti]|uniref:Uncharacterized protein n=1 Tax=Ectobacillus ponti TaxID=2961894 RepID=A0AA41X9B6_9BACI|nr:hypothetical protein [Ectobacillus ponti]MCP8967756.1 hypothetical protein [Ectobacillus ponti]
MKKNWLFWLPVGAAAVWAGSHFLGFGGHGHEMMQGAQGMMQGGHGAAQGGAGAAQGHGMGHGGRGGFGFGWSKAVIGAGLAILGISLRKSAGETTWKKWAGYGLLAAGLVAIAKPILPVLAIGAGAYWLYKKKGSSKKEDFVTVPVEAAIVSSNAAALDAWEHNISKEDK